MHQRERDTPTSSRKDGNHIATVIVGVAEGHVIAGDVKPSGHCPRDVDADEVHHRTHDRGVVHLPWSCNVTALITMNFANSCTTLVICSKHINGEHSAVPRIKLKLYHILIVADRLLVTDEQPVPYLTLYVYTCTNYMLS